MRLELTAEETDLLRSLLQDYLPALRIEVSRTEARDLRHELAQRQEFVERLLAQLQRETT
jgi:hypothetical protein